MAYRIPSIHSKQVRRYSSAEAQERAYLEDMLAQGNPDATYDEAFGPARSDEVGEDEIDRGIPSTGDYESYDPDTDTKFKDTGEKATVVGPTKITKK